MVEVAVKRAVLYLRVSTDSQVGRDGDAEGYSIPAQREAGHRKAQELGAEVIQEYADPGISGRTSQRPGLQALLERIRTRGDVDYVIVWKLSRWSRSPLVDATLELELIERGVRLVSVTENIDETPGGKLLRRILGTINAYEVDNLAQGVAAGMERKVKTGGTPAMAPLGYVNVRKVIDGVEVKTVELDADRASLVRWIFEAYASGNYTITSLLREATERGLRTRPSRKRPSKPLARSGFAKMLKNPYYVGVIRFKGVEYPGRHQPLITRELFERVQQMLEDNSNGEKVQHHAHYLKGSIFCLRCLSRLSLTYSQGNGGIYPYFFCLGRQAGNGCDQPYLPVDEVEDRVLTLLANQELDSEASGKLRINFRTQLQEDRKRLIAEASRQAKRLEALKSERRKLLDLHYRDVIAIDLFEEEQRRINRETAVAEEAITAASQQWEAVERAHDELFDLIGDIGDLYRRSDGPRRRRINRCLFVKILVDEDQPIRGELHESAPKEALLPYARQGRTAVGANIMQKAVACLSKANPALASLEPGSNFVTLVAAGGLEPPTQRL